MLVSKEDEEGKFVLMAISLGTVKKTSMALFSRPRASGIIAVALDPGDKLVGVAIAGGHKDTVPSTTGGKAMRFVEEEVRAMGREAAGVGGVKLSDEERVDALIVAEQGFILTASQNGFGKLTPLDEFPKHGRGGQGVIALQITDRNGRMVGAMQVSLDDEIMLMSQNGVLVRTPVKDISVVGRNTQGVRLIRLEEGDHLSGLERIDGMARVADGVDEGADGTWGLCSWVRLTAAWAQPTVEYATPGHWPHKAIAGGGRYWKVNVAGDAGGDYTGVPPQSELRFSAGAAYAHYTPNETVSGV